MNKDDTPPTAHTAVMTCHSTARLRANASWTSALISGGSVDNSGMTVYKVGTPVLCGME